MNTVKVIDNFLEKKDFKSLSQTLSSDYFPWYFNSGTEYPDPNNLHSFQFTHTFYFNNEILSSWFNNIECILNKLQPTELLKIKANLQPYTDKMIEGNFHIDVYDKNSLTAVYYVNTNNGYTMFEDGTKIESIENRIILFDSNLLHKGSTCSDSKYRNVLNFNFKKDGVQI